MSTNTIYHQLKAQLNRRLDRVINEVDERLRALEGMPPTLWRNAYRCVLSQVADVCWLVQHSPRVDAWRWQGCRWSVVYAGSNYHMARLQNILCPQAQSLSLSGRVSIWDLPAKATRWAGTAELVVCELNRRQPWRSTATYSFVMAPWVRLVLDVGRSREAIIGSMRRSMRKRLRKVMKSDLICRYSYDPADFEVFYHSMFVPFVESRFQGDRAFSAPYDDLLAEFQRGGLIVVERDGEPVSGVICRQTRSTFYSVWGGVLNADYGLIRSGVQVARVWFGISLAQQMGCRYYDFGWALASMQDGLLRFKLSWGMQIRSDYRLHENWIFLSTSLPADLRRHLNDRQFLTKVDGRHYILFLSNPQDSQDSGFIAERLGTAQRYGLGGVLIVKRGCSEKRPARS